MRRALIVVAWASAAILLGCLIGLLAVVLPPMSVFGVVALAVLISLWVMPDLPVQPYRSIRRLLLVVLIVHLGLPYYSTIQIASLPWISARRMVTLPLIALFAIAYSSSSETRRRIASVLRENRAIAICVLGFPAMAVVSIVTAANPIVSIGAVSQSVLEWYLPFLAVLYVVREERQVEMLTRVILWCSLAIALMGIFEFIVQKNLYVSMLPSFLVDDLMANNPSFGRIVTKTFYRNGMYRSSSLYFVSLSFAEFEAMIAPLAMVFAVYGRTLRDRALGAVFVIAAVAGIFVSGSRGGYVSVIVAFVATVVLYLVRTYRFEFRSLKPALVGAMAAGGFAILFGLILFWRLHVIVLGGGMEQYSNEARETQWAMGLPHILANPLTGHGYGQGAEVVNFNPYGVLSIDSFLLAALVETGVPGVVFFFGGLLLCIWTGVKRYLSDPSWRGALMGGLACSLLAFLTYRTVLAQRENFLPMYLFVACIISLNCYYSEGKAKAVAAPDGSAKLRPVALAH